MNQKILRYVKDQEKKGVSADSLRLKMINSGWDPQITDEIINDVYKLRKASSKMVFIIAALLVILLLLILLFLSRQHVPTQAPAVPVAVDETCSDLTNQIDKDSCYKKEVAKGFDCDTLLDSFEEAFCYRAKDNYLIIQ